MSGEYSEACAKKGKKEFNFLNSFFPSNLQAIKGSSSTVQSCVDEGYPPGSPGKILFQLTAMVIILYMVLVPAVLFTAPGVPVSRQ